VERGENILLLYRMLTLFFFFPPSRLCTNWKWSFSLLLVLCLFFQASFQ